MLANTALDQMLSSPPGSGAAGASPRMEGNGNYFRRQVRCAMDYNSGIVGVTICHPPPPLVLLGSGMCPPLPASHGRRAP